jgi:ABC-type branched-subunit amino acid transport system substrate-binding protein
MDVCFSPVRGRGKRLEQSKLKRREMVMKSFVRIVALVFLISILFLASTSNVLAQKDPYKIGVNLSLTGPLAQLMAYVKNGLILEQERINAQGGIDGHQGDYWTAVQHGHTHAYANCGPGEDP